MPPKTLSKTERLSKDASFFTSKVEDQSLSMRHTVSGSTGAMGGLSLEDKTASVEKTFAINETEIENAYLDLGFMKPIPKDVLRDFKMSAKSREVTSRKMKEIRSAIPKKQFRDEPVAEGDVRSFAETLMDIDITEMVAVTDNELIEKYELYTTKIFSNIPLFEKLLKEGAARDWLDGKELELTAKLTTVKDLARMYEAKARLLGNRYYMLLGDKPFKDESRDELFVKLKKETMKKHPDAALIEYYENRIRMLDSADLTKKGIAKREQKHLKRLKDKKRKEAERADYENKVREARELLQKPLERRSEDVSDAVRRAMKKNMFAEKLTDDDATDHVTKEQQEGIDLVMAWLLSVCNEGKRSYESFALRLLKYPKRQQLAALYLIEKDKLESATKMDVFASQAFYVPDLNEVKSRLVPGRLGRFIRRMRKGSSYDWDKLSTAFEVVSKSKEDLAEYDAMVKDTELTESQSKGADRNKNLMDLSMKKSGILMAHMQSFGITPDMPLDMIEDEEVREKLQQEYQENVNILSEISDYCHKDNKDPAEMLLELFRKKPKELKDDAYGQGFSTLDDVGTVMDVISFLQDRTYDVMNLMGNVKTAQIVDGVSGIIGGTSDYFHTIYEFRKLFETVYDNTLAEEEQNTAMMYYVGRGVRFAGNATRQNVFFTRAFLNLTEATNNLIYSISGGVFAVGAVLDGISRRKKIKDCEASIKELSEGEQKLLNVDKKDLTNEDKTLSMFLNHRKDAMTREKRTATVDSYMAATYAVGGALMINPATVAVGTIVKTVADIGKPLFADLPDYISKKRERLRLIDDYLCLDELVKDVKDEHPKIAEKELRELVRTEAMAQLGFNGKEAMHRHIAGLMADIIYKNAYKKDDGSYYTQKEYEADQKNADPKAISKRGAYLSAVRSLGLKISLPESPGTAPLVTPELLTARIMG